MWYTITTRYDLGGENWSKDYKRQVGAHNHNAQAAFIVTAKTDAVQRLQNSGQAKYANVTTNQIGTTGLQVNLPNDPGPNYTVI